MLYISSYLDADLTDFVSIRNSFYCYIIHRKVTKNPRLLIDEMCMCCVVALVVGLAIDTRKASEESLFRHGFYITVYGGSSNLVFLSTHFLKYIISREVTTSTGIADYVAVLMGTHTSIMRKNLKKSNFTISYISVYNSQIECNLSFQKLFKLYPISYLTITILLSELSTIEPL